MLFIRKKHQKLPAQSKNSRNVLRNVDNTALSHPVRCKLRLHCARLYAGGIVDLQANSCHIVSTQPNIACRLSLFVSVQALRDLCGLALLKNITLPHFKHVLAYSWTETGFHYIFNSAGFVLTLLLLTKKVFKSWRICYLPLLSIRVYNPKRPNKHLTLRLQINILI